MADLQPEPIEQAAAELMGPSDPVEREGVLVGADADIDAGGGVPHDAVRTWLIELAAGRPSWGFGTAHKTGRMQGWHSSA